MNYDKTLLLYEFITKTYEKEDIKSFVKLLKHQYFQTGTKRRKLNIEHESQLHFLDIPREVLIISFSYLWPPDLCRLFSVCRSIFEIAKLDSIWKIHCDLHFKKYVYHNHHIYNSKWNEYKILFEKSPFPTGFSVQLAPRKIILLMQKINEQYEKQYEEQSHHDLILDVSNIIKKEWENIKILNLLELEKNQQIKKQFLYDITNLEYRLILYKSKLLKYVNHAYERIQLKSKDGINSMLSPIVLRRPTFVRCSSIQNIFNYHLQNIKIKNIKYHFRSILKNIQNIILDLEKDETICEDMNQIIITLNNIQDRMNEYFNQQKINQKTKQLLQECHFHFNN